MAFCIGKELDSCTPLHFKNSVLLLIPKEEVIKIIDRMSFYRKDKIKLSSGIEIPICIHYKCRECFIGKETMDYFSNMIVADEL